MVRHHMNNIIRNKTKNTIIKSIIVRNKVINRLLPVIPVIPLLLTVLFDYNNCTTTPYI
jgi:hypothetical protein